MADEQSKIDQAVRAFDQARGATSAPPLSPDAPLDVVRVETDMPTPPQSTASSGFHAQPHDAAPFTISLKTEAPSTGVHTSGLVSVATDRQTTTIQTPTGPTLDEIETLLGNMFGPDWKADLVAQTKDAVVDDLGVVRDQLQADVKKDAPQIVMILLIASGVIIAIVIILLVYLLAQAISGHNPVAESYVRTLADHLAGLPQWIKYAGLLLFPSPLGTVVTKKQAVTGTGAS